MKIINKAEKWYIVAIMACGVISFLISLAPVAIPVYTDITLSHPEALAFVALAVVLAVVELVLLYRLRAGIPAQKPKESCK